MRPLLYGTFWIGIYLIIIVAPLLVLLIGPIPPGRGFWREFSVAKGFVGLSMIGLQFFLTGRFRHITSPYGIDVVYHFHRQISTVAFVLILLHPLILFISAPDTLLFLSPVSSPWWITMGTAALVALAILILTSIKRKEWGIRYERWRLTHAFLSIGVVALSLVHIEGVGYYVQGPLKRWFWIGLVTAWILSLVYVRIVKPIGMFRRPYTVEEVVKERGKTWTLVLRPKGHPGITFKPGQFAWLKIGKSPFAIREHPFSFSSSAMRSDQIEISIKELGDFTSKIGEVSPGTRAYLDGPYGTFTTDSHTAPGYVFIVGGVRISPIISILRTFADRHEKRPLLLFYSSKTWEEVTFREALEKLTGRLNLRVVHTLTNPPEEWEGERGRITAEMMGRYLPENRADCEYFICGPDPMQMAVKEALQKLGLPLEKVESESFNFI
ncbi:MAG: ferredoxin reductase family protein [Thermodesulfobacteriota bacterium]